MKSLIILGLLIILSLISLCGCDGKDREFTSSLYDHKKLSELTELSCEEYKQTALCESYAFLFNIEHFGSSYSKTKTEGKITIVTLFGDMSRRVPLRCNIDTLLFELVGLNNKKGALGRFGDSFTLLGTRYITCDKKISDTT